MSSEDRSRFERDKEIDDQRHFNWRTRLAELSNPKLFVYWAGINSDDEMPEWIGRILC